MRRDHLERLVLSLLSGGEVPAPALLRRLAAAGSPLEPAEFVGLMADLEVRRLVRGRYPEGSEHDPAGPCFYRSTPAGLAARSLPDLPAAA